MNLLVDDGVDEANNTRTAKVTLGTEFWKKEIGKLKNNPYSPQPLHVDLRKFIETLKEKSKLDKKRQLLFSAILEKNLLPNDFLGKPISQVYDDLRPRQPPTA